MARLDAQALLALSLLSTQLFKFSPSRQAQPEIAQKLGIKGYPALRYFHQGGPAEEYVGMRNSEATFLSGPPLLTILGWKSFVKFLNSRNGLSRRLKVACFPMKVSSPPMP